MSLDRWCSTSSAGLILAIARLLRLSVLLVIADAMLRGATCNLALLVKVDSILR